MNMKKENSGILNKIRRVSLQKAGICSIIIAVIGITVHILLLAHILPYTWINGGRSPSFAQAAGTSTSSIVILLFNIVITMIASEIIPVKQSRGFKKVLGIFLLVSLPFGFLGIVQQFLGTMFEKCLMSIVTIVGFCADTRVAMEKRW